MKYTYRKRALPGSPRIEWTLLRDGEAVVTDIAADSGTLRKDVLRAVLFLDALAAKRQEAAHVAG